VLVRGWVFAKDGFEPLRNRIAFLVLSPEGQTDAWQKAGTVWSSTGRANDVTEVYEGDRSSVLLGFEVSFLLKDYGRRVQAFGA